MTMLRKKLQHLFSLVVFVLFTATGVSAEKESAEPNYVNGHWFLFGLVGHANDMVVDPTPQYAKVNLSIATKRVRVRRGGGRPSLPLNQLGPLPTNTASKYLETKYAGLSIDTKHLRAEYNLTLKACTGLPYGAVLEVHFENPEDQDTPIVATVRRQGGKDSIMITSPPVKGFRCANYSVDIFVYRTAAKTRLLGTHQQFVQSRVNLDKVKSSKDLIKALTTSNCP
jgi:hypothetical protein